MNICVFCGAKVGLPEHREKAFSVGKAIALKGHRLLYGGSDLGLMGEVGRGCHDNGGHVTSIIPSFFLEEGVNDPFADERIVVSSMGERKQKMMDMGDLFIALPGGIGTLDEIGDVLTAVSLRKKKAKVILCDFGGFYEPFGNLIATMKENGYIPDPWIAEPIYAKDISKILEYL